MSRNPMIPFDPFPITVTPVPLFYHPTQTGIIQTITERLTLCFFHSNSGQYNKSCNNLSPSLPNSKHSSDFCNTQTIPASPFHSCHQTVTSSDKSCQTVSFFHSISTAIPFHPCFQTETTHTIPASPSITLSPLPPYTNQSDNS